MRHRCAAYRGGNFGLRGVGFPDIVESMEEPVETDPSLKEYPHIRTSIHVMYLTVLVACGLITHWAYRETIAVQEQRAVDAQKALALARIEAASRKELGARMQAKLDEVVKAFAATSDRLAAANADNQRLKAADQRRIEDAKLALKVPLPVVLNGEYVFPKLVNSKLETVGENAEFSSRYGRTVIFKGQDGGRLKFDVDQLHSVVLAELGIDPEIAKADQARLEARDKALAERGTKVTPKTNAPIEGVGAPVVKGVVAQEKTIEQERQHSLETDRSEAEEAMKRANDAVAAAQKL
jgi:hypothetical protein